MTLRTVPVLAAGLILSLNAQQGLAAQVDLSAAQCPEQFTFENSACKAALADFSKLKANECSKGGGHMNKDGTVCLPPAPSCKKIAGGTLAFKDGKCLYEVKVPTSSTADYVGDYFKIITVPADDPGLLGAPPGEHIRVLSQSTVDNERLLTVVQVRDERIVNPALTSRNTAPVGAPVTVSASDLIKYGADRKGWAYGVLAVPFKYYPKSKNFGAGVSVGPYVGWRTGRAGSATTFAMSAAIGSVKGEVYDDVDKTKIVSTPDLMAYSLAGGIMWEIAKSQEARPFRVGLFTGWDSVSSDDKVKFKNNRKQWIAFQIGYDFTDN